METHWKMHSILVQKHLLKRTYLVRNFQSECSGKKPCMNPLLIHFLSHFCLQQLFCPRCLVVVWEEFSILSIEQIN